MKMKRKRRSRDKACGMLDLSLKDPHTHLEGAMLRPVLHTWAEGAVSPFLKTQKPSFFPKSRRGPSVSNYIPTLSNALLVGRKDRLGKAGIDATRIVLACEIVIFLA